MNVSKKQIVIAASVVGVVLIVLIALILRSRSQMSEMTEVFTEERDLLTSQYEDLYVEYDGIKAGNDSLDNLLSEQRARVEQLTEELKTLKASNARRIKELQGELTSLRTIMRSFLVQIDSLNHTNSVLRQENADMKGRLAEANTARASLLEQNETLNQKVATAAKLDAKDIEVFTLNAKGQTTGRLAKISKIKVAFTLDKNISAEVGMRDVFLRITRPDGDVLYHSQTDTFRFEDSDVNYSAKRSVEYGGEDTPSTIVYIVQMGDLMEGAYDVELFAGGYVIGRASFSI